MTGTREMEGGAVVEDGWDGPGNCKARVKRQGLYEAVRQPQNHEVQLQTGF